MKLGKRQLKRIIREEKAKLIAETKVRRLVRHRLREGAESSYTHGSPPEPTPYPWPEDLIVDDNSGYGEDGTPKGPHSEVHFGSASQDGYDAQISVYDASDREIDTWDILSPPNYHEGGWDNVPIDMTDFVGWARKHDLFNLPAYVHEWPATTSFAEVIESALTGDYGDPYTYPPGTPGAS